MRIKIDLKIFLFLVIFILTRQIEFYSLIILFTFMHEIGHLICGILFGCIPESLTIAPFGIGIVFRNYGKNQKIHIKNILIALAGPLTNIFIIILSNFFFKNKEVYASIVYSNLLIAIFNLIAIYPLDGGRILKSILEIKYGKIVSEKISMNINNILVITITLISSITILYTKNIAIPFIAFYLWYIVIDENKKSKIRIRAYQALAKGLSVKNGEKIKL